MSSKLMFFEVPVQDNMLTHIDYWKLISDLKPLRFIESFTASIKKEETYINVIYKEKTPLPEQFSLNGKNLVAVDVKEDNSVAICVFVDLKMGRCVNPINDRSTMAKDSCEFWLREVLWWDWVVKPTEIR